MAPDEVDRLFVVPPALFVAARKALARTLRGAGRREEAAALEKRPRPSVSTWATNQVARNEPGLIRELGEVTARLQAGGGPDYAEAVAQHRALLKTLRAKAEEALRAAGLRAALPALAQVLQNLRAGMASPETKPLVETGRILQDIATAEEASLFDGAAVTPRTGEMSAAGPRAPAGDSRGGEPAREGRDAESARERERREAESARDRERERERRERRALLQREAMRLRSNVEIAEAARDREERALTEAGKLVAAAEVRLAAARAALEERSAELNRAEASLAAIDG